MVKELKFSMDDLTKGERVNLSTQKLYKMYKVVSLELISVFGDGAKGEVFCNIIGEGSNRRLNVEFVDALTGERDEQKEYIINTLLQTDLREERPEAYPIAHMYATLMEREGIECDLVSEGVTTETNEVVKENIFIEKDIIDQDLSYEEWKFIIEKSLEQSLAGEKNYQVYSCVGYDEDFLNRISESKRESYPKYLITVSRYGPEISNPELEVRSRDDMVLRIDTKNKEVSASHYEWDNFSEEIELIKENFLGNVEEYKKKIEESK